MLSPVGVNYNQIRVISLLFVMHVIKRRADMRLDDIKCLIASLDKEFCHHFEDREFSISD